MKPSSHSHSQSSLFSLSLTFANQAGKKSKSPRDRFWQNEDVDPNHTSFIQHDLPLPLLDKRHSEQLPPDSLPHPRSPSLPFRTIRRLRSSSQHPRPTGRPHNRLRPSFPLPSPFLLLVLFLPSSPSCVYSCYCPMLCGRAHIFLQVGKIPSWQSVHGLTVDFASIGVKVKDVYIPPAKTPDGKRRKNNRCFGFVECLNEHHAQRACVSSAFREPSLLSSSSSSVSR
jgi:hypothetical protein